MSLDSALESVTGLVKSDLAQHFIIDTSATGNRFTNGHHPINLSTALARSRYLRASTLMHSFRSAESFVHFLRDHEKVGTTNTVIQELMGKIRAISKFIELYNEGREAELDKPQDPYHPTLSADKGKLFLRRTLAREVDAVNILKHRINQPDTQSLAFLEELVINTTLRNYPERKNYNDEKIVAEAIYKAFSDKRPVSIITRDSRFKRIAINVYNLLRSEPKLRKLHDFLGGNLSVIYGEDGQYKLDYRYGDRPKLN